MTETQTTERSVTPMTLAIDAQIETLVARRPAFARLITEWRETDWNGTQPDGRVLMWIAAYTAAEPFLTPQDLTRYEMAEQFMEEAWQNWDRRTPPASKNARRIWKAHRLLIRLIVRGVERRGELLPA